MLMIWARCRRCWEPSGPAAVWAEVASFFHYHPSSLGPCPPRNALDLYLHPFPPPPPRARDPVSEHLHSCRPPRFVPPAANPATSSSPPPRARSCLAAPAAACSAFPLSGLAPLHPPPSAPGLPCSQLLPPPRSPLLRPGQLACRCLSRVPNRTFAAGAVRTVCVDPGRAPGAVMEGLSAGGMGILRGEEGRAPRPGPHWSPDPQRPLGPSERAPAEALA